jgi:hypothetical protein
MQVHNKLWESPQWNTYQSLFFFNIYIYKTSKNYLIGLVKLKVLIYDLLKKKEFIKPTQNPGDHSGGRKPDGSQPLDINGVKHNLNIILNHYLSCIKKKSIP